MWKASVGAKVKPSDPGDDDGDWETDPDFINNVTEQEQRWGSKTIEGSGRTVGAIDMNKLREETTKVYEDRQKANGPVASYGYGGKFGVEKDRMDKSALGHDYLAKVEKHVSQTDYSTGFGGKFGVQTDRVDKSAMSWDHKESIEKHTSQRDYSTGFGGKYGVQRDRQDKSAVGWDHVEKPQKHDSQSVGKSPGVGEPSQRPSQLKAKFENLAKQNEVSNIPPRPKPKQPVQKIRFTPAVDRSEEKTVRQEATKPVKVPTQAVPVSQVVEPEPVLHVPEPAPVTPSSISSPKEPVQQREEVHKVHVAAVQELQPVDTEDHLIGELQVNQEDEDEEESSNYKAVALYDYQAAAEDEISFDPDEIIENIELIDEGWWRGTCRGVTGLFPANYVQLQPQE